MDMTIPPKYKLYLTYATMVVVLAGAIILNDNRAVVLALLFGYGGVINGLSEIAESSRRQEAQLRELTRLLAQAPRPLSA